MDNTSFFVGLNRAMVSLGPLSPKKYCTYSCPFCYVNAGFNKYSKTTILETVEWLKRHNGMFDVIYVSGDTDSFAPPRMDLGIDLLEALSDFEVDLLFTTRAIFKKAHLVRLEYIKNKLAKSKKLLFGCVSVAQLYQPRLEPKPIASPIERIEQLRLFKNMGLVSIHAMRPFLPVVPLNEYLELIDLVKSKADIILGEVWYADKTGILESATLGDLKRDGLEFSEHQMDFDSNTSIWRVYESKEVELSVAQKCEDIQIPFFMRSSSAVEWARNNFMKYV